MDREAAATFAAEQFEALGYLLVVAGMGLASGLILSGDKHQGERSLYSVRIERPATEREIAETMAYVRERGKRGHLPEPGMALYRVSPVPD